MRASVAFLDVIETERERRMAGRATPDRHATTLWMRALERESPADRALLTAARDFAMGIDYRHEGLASDIYAAHPLRVAAMALLSGAAPGIEAGIVGLLHNVLEVSSVGALEIDRRFGENIRAQVVSLTVDRFRQWESTYKRSYYDALAAGPVAARVVKVFDKLDNLYLLGLNPDTDIKTQYVREIQTYVLPMAARDVPAVTPYLTALLKQTIVTERLEMPAV